MPNGAERERLRTERWRRQLLPLMSRFIVGLTAFFLLVSLGQLTYLHWRLEQTQAVDLTAPMAILSKVGGASSADGLTAATTMIMARLEANALDRRYHQATVVLMARVWTSYLGFVTGMILALVGAVFILGRVDTVTTTLEGKAGTVRGQLRTSAPGIVLASLGVVLMVATLFIRYDITVTDSAVYARPTTQLPERQAPAVHWPQTSASPENASGPH